MAYSRALRRFVAAAGGGSGGPGPQPPAPTSYRIERTLDRTFTDTPGSGGGNVSPDEFEHEGDSWQLWQVLPFVGASVDSGAVGRCRIQIRDRSVGRGQNLLENMPTRIELSASGAETADWTGLPWAFTRSAENFRNVGSGNAARKSVDYLPTRSIPAGQTPAQAGVGQGETFTITLIFE